MFIIYKVTTCRDSKYGYSENERFFNTFEKAKDFFDNTIKEFLALNENKNTQEQIEEMLNQLKNSTRWHNEYVISNYLDMYLEEIKVE